MVKNIKIIERLREGEIKLLNAFIIFATALLTLILRKEVSSRWLSLTWTLEGICVLGAGFILRYKIYRISGLSVLSLVCLRLIFVDMAGVNTIYKILTFIILGSVLLGASFVYSKFMVKKMKEEINFKK